MSKADRIALLIFHYLRNDLTPEQSSELEEWRSAAPENEIFFQREIEPENIRQLLGYAYVDGDKVWAKVIEQMPHLANADRPPRVIWPRVAVAAAILLAIGTGIYFFLGRSSAVTSPADNIAAASSKDIQPGGDHARLTLANGATVYLDTLKIGQLSGVNALKKDSGELVYAQDAANNDLQNEYNQLQTPRGGQYKVTLPDGSQVWLNAASSLKYPMAFGTNERRVELAGEGYFEVAKSTVPFKVVITENATVQVLGTHFNINAYNDEPFVRTTLLEGSIQLTRNGDSHLLRPGEQAVYSEQSPVSVNRDADLVSVVAWKNGRTFFKDASVQSIMRMVSRWYDVDVAYEGTVAPRKITGALSRQASLDELLRVLSLNNIHYSLSGRVITVRP